MRMIMMRVHDGWCCGWRAGVGGGIGIGSTCGAGGGRRETVRFCGGEGQAMVGVAVRMRGGFAALGVAVGVVGDGGAFVARGAGRDAAVLFNIYSGSA